MTSAYDYIPSATSALLETCANTATSDSRFINELLMMGANINASCTQGTTPLMRAALSGNAEKVQHLIDCGAHLDAVNPACGRTAYAMAVAQGHADAARRLMRAGSLAQTFNREQALRRPAGLTGHDVFRPAFNR